MYDEMRDRFQIKSTVIIDELMEEWDEVVQPADYVIEVMNKPDLQVALLSNVGFEHAKRMSKVLNYGDFFKNSIKHFSCQVGARKPSLLYYHIFIQLHPEFVGSPYIDDLQENLDIAEQFGFRPFRFSIDELTAENYKERLGQLESFIMGSWAIQEGGAPDIFSM